MIFKWSFLHVIRLNDISIDYSDLANYDNCAKFCPTDAFTLEFKSAIAFGKAEIVTDDIEKREALRAICQRFLPSHMGAFETAVGRSMSRTVVVRITLTEPPVGKRKQYDANGDELKYGRM